jgi:hypothetical protein
MRLPPAAAGFWPCGRPRSPGRKGLGLPPDQPSDDGAEELRVATVAHRGI